MDVTGNYINKTTIRLKNHKIFIANTIQGREKKTENY